MLPKQFALKYSAQKSAASSNCNNALVFIFMSFNVSKLAKNHIKGYHKDGDGERNAVKKFIT